MRERGGWGRKGGDEGTRSVQSRRAAARRPWCGGLAAGVACVTAACQHARLRPGAAAWMAAAHPQAGGPAVTHLPELADQTVLRQCRMLMPSAAGRCGRQRPYDGTVRAVAPNSRHAARAAARIRRTRRAAPSPCECWKVHTSRLTVPLHALLGSPNRRSSPAAPAAGPSRVRAGNATSLCHR